MYKVTLTAIIKGDGICTDLNVGECASIHEGRIMAQKYLKEQYCETFSEWPVVVEDTEDCYHERSVIEFIPDDFLGYKQKDPKMYELNLSMQLWYIDKDMEWFENSDRMYTEYELLIKKICE